MLTRGLDGWQSVVDDAMWIGFAPELDYIKIPVIEATFIVITRAETAQICTFQERKLCRIWSQHKRRIKTTCFAPWSTHTWYAFSGHTSIYCFRECHVDTILLVEGFLA